MIRHLSTSRVLFLGALVGTLSAAACSGGNSEESGTTDPEQLASSCSLSITQNFYDGPNAWGTIEVKNAGPSTASGYVVQFDVPSGAHCTNDTVPSGATLSPLSGSAAETKSNQCVFTFTGSLAKSATKTFNYSTDSTSFSKASNAAATSASCGSSGSGGAGGATSAGGASAGGSPAKGGAGSGGTAGKGGTASGGTAGSGTAGSSGGNVLADCTIAGGCPLNVNCACANPADDPLASTSPSKYDMYDACRPYEAPK